MADNYDTVDLDHPEKGLMTLQPAEFWAVPLLDRVRWIGQGRFVFYKNGEKVQASLALKKD